MKSKRIISLLICNLITYSINASEDMKNEMPYTFPIEDKKNLNNTQYNSHHLEITNPNLNCALISLLHCLQYLNNTDNELISQLRERYNQLFALQQLSKNYEVLPEDFILFLLTNNIKGNSILKNMDNQLFDVIKETITSAHKIAEYLINQKCEDVNTILSELKQVQNNINLIKEKLNINKICNNSVEINKILAANNDANDVLNYIKELFLKLKGNIIDDILPVYELLYDYDTKKYTAFDMELNPNNNTNTKKTDNINKEKNPEENKMNTNNNAIVNCNNALYCYDKELQKVTILPYIDDMIKKLMTQTKNLENLQSLNSQLFNNKQMKLKAIVIAFYDIFTETTFHYAALIKQDDGTLKIIDHSKIYNGNTTINSNELNNLFTNIFDFKNIYTYRLLPSILFYSNTSNIHKNDTFESKLNVLHHNAQDFKRKYPDYIIEVKNKSNTYDQNLFQLSQAEIDYNNEVFRIKENNDISRKNEYENNIEHNLEDFNYINTNNRKYNNATLLTRKTTRDNIPLKENNELYKNNIEKELKNTKHNINNDNNSLIEQLPLDEDNNNYLSDNKNIIEHCKSENMHHKMSKENNLPSDDKVNLFDQKKIIKKESELEANKEEKEIEDNKSEHSNNNQDQSNYSDSEK